MKEYLDTVYDMGYNRGYNIGRQLILDYEVSVEDDDMDEAKEAYYRFAGEIEDIDRQFSPFEFLAKEFNSEPNSDEIWDRFDNGIWDGINKAWDEIFDK
jgi:hypothetical protein